MKRAIFILITVILTLTLTACGQTTVKENKDVKNVSEGTAIEQSNAQSDEKSEEVKSADVEDENVNDIKKILEKAEKIDGLYYETVSTMGDKEYTQKIWKQGDYLKISSIVEGEESIYIDDGEYTVTYSTSTMQGYKMKNDLGMNVAEEESINDPSEIDDNADLKVIGEEKINGYDCVLASMTDTETSAENKVWISKKYGIAVKSEIKDAETGTTITYECKNIKAGKLPEKTFKVPDNVKIIDSSAGIDVSEE